MECQPRPPGPDDLSEGRVRMPISAWCAWLAVLAPILFVITSCNAPHNPAANVKQSDLDAGWPQANDAWRQTTVLPAGWEEGKIFWRPSTYPRLRAALPGVEGATYVGDDSQCLLCHETYVRAFANNVHRQQGCEKCHGPASRHVASRGLERGSILSLKPIDQVTAAGKPVDPVERNEICLQCHEAEPHGPGTSWRVSTHAHNKVACTGCHTSHYNVPPGTPPALIGAAESFGPPRQAAPVAYLQPPPGQSLKGTSQNLGAVTPGTCYRCHERMKRFEEVMHPHRIGAPIQLPPGWGNKPVEHGETFDCSTCHGPHGNVTRETRRALCLECHEGAHMTDWRGSPHDLAGVACTDCHNPHPEQGLPMAVNQPQACYRCHSDKRHLQEIAHPHQLLGPNGFNCTTCHRPHGRVTSATRTDLCLRCHTGTPTMAWHSSIHFREGVACADCHSAHPTTEIQQVVAIDHTPVRRRRRLPMSVNEPQACYKCHPKIFALTSMPSRHPIREGKLVCSRCHDGHGQNQGNLKTETVNMLCYQCHAEKQGPFVWEHPPVTENCAICHEPHGTVTNNLLRQPTTFLCLRCHTGHSTHGGSPQCLRCHFAGGATFNVGGGPRDPAIPTTPAMRQALFTDCTQCHSQIHGSDSPSGYEDGHGMRR